MQEEVLKSFLSRKRFIQPFFIAFQKDDIIIREYFDGSDRKKGGETASTGVIETRVAYRAFTASLIR